MAVTSPLRVALVHDHPLVVEGLSSMLRPYADRVQVVELMTPGDSTAEVDVALCDAFAMDGPAHDELDRLTVDPKIQHVALYTWNLAPEQTDIARRSGVTAVLSKELDAAALVVALERVAACDPVQQEHPEGVAEPEAGTRSGRDSGLTPREAEIVTLIGSGMSNNQIAERMYLSINSVKSYIRSAYRTMGVSSRSQAVLWALDHGMGARPTRATIHTS